MLQRVERQETEVMPKPKRRTFTAKYKRDIVRKADGCTEPGETGALLRREGLYSSHLADWRREMEAGQLSALAPKKRGPKGKQVDPQAEELVMVRRQLAEVTARAERAELLVEIQKKLSLLLGVELPKLDEDR
jgi:transposase